MKKGIKRIVVTALITITALMPLNTFAAAPAFKPTFKEAVAVNNNRSDNVRPVSNSGYLDTQGLAFDIYTKKDGYVFNKGTDGNKDFQLVHFKTNGAKITKKQAVKYKAANVGHANDATMFRAKGNKYILFAVSGGTEKASKTSDGKTCKVGVIWLDEYNKGKAKVRACTIKVNDDVTMRRSVANSCFSGITYTGMRKVAGKERPVFVLMDGLNFYAAYFTVNDSRAITLTIFDRARIAKPKITGSYEASTQGVTYHRDYLYIPYSGEKQKATYQNMMIGRISYAKLFKGTYATENKLQVNRKTYKTSTIKEGKKSTKVTISKFFPEAIFFKTLNGKGQLYMTVNRANKANNRDIDVIMTTKQQY